MLTARTRRTAVAVGVALAALLPATSALAEPSIDDIQRQIQTSSAALGKVVEDFNTTNAQLGQTQRAAAEVTAKLAPLQAHLDAAQHVIGELAVEAYTTGRFAALGALLDAGSSQTLVDRATLLDHVARERNAAIATVIATRDQVTQERRKLDALVAAQAAAKATLAARKAQIEKDLTQLYALRQRAYGSATEKPSVSTATPPAVSGKAGVAVRFAYAQLGKPYVWAADGPGGYDCSGLTLASWRAAGVSLTHSAAVQYRETVRISRSSLQPGDLVFYSSLGHVALYVGGGKVIHAPTFGEVVKISTVDMMSPYGFGRVRS